MCDKMLAREMAGGSRGSQGMQGEAGEAGKEGEPVYSMDEQVGW